MEDILASIRETVEEEVGKSNKPSAKAESVSASTAQEEDVMQGLSALAGLEDEADTEIQTQTPKSEALDVLELTEVVSPAEEHIDVEEFARSGELTNADLDEVLASREAYQEDAPAKASAAEVEASDDDIDVDIDSIMSELETDSSLPSEDDAASFIAQNNVEEAAVTTNSKTEESVSEPVLQAPVKASTEKVATEVAEEVARKVFLPTTPSAKGLQVSFPAEVLAEALRPLVSDWINANLADIVERLVKEEISKLIDR